MTAYKLLRRKKDGSLGSLFVGRASRLSFGVTYEARSDLPHPGLAHRPGFHCTHAPYAPHIKMRLKNGEERVWCTVKLSGEITPHQRPASQGGLWYTAEKMRLLREL